MPRRRPKREYENDEFLAAARRFLLAGGARVAAGDIESLALLVGLKRTLRDAETDAVRGLLSDGVYSMTDIARVLGITRQVAWKKYNHLQPDNLREMEIPR